jgi:hypothetical protein
MTETDIPIIEDDFAAALGFLEEDLFDTADLRSEEGNDEVAKQLEALAEETPFIDTALVVEYAKAREVEEERDGPDVLHCSMTMEIGYLLNPRDAEDVARIYIKAAAMARNEFPSDLFKFWTEFVHAGHA